jgi:hypothetical protein
MELRQRSEHSGQKEIDVIWRLCIFASPHTGRAQLQMASTSGPIHCANSIKYTHRSSSSRVYLCLLHISIVAVVLRLRSEGILGKCEG